MMLTVISPAKKLDYSQSAKSQEYSQPLLLKHSEELLNELRLLSPEDICSLMSLSDKLGALNFERFKNGKHPFLSITPSRPFSPLKAMSIRG
jgi:cytoplasmic iron level regulating protein YaaA (DUF328/UPF0246 family)